MLNKSTCCFLSTFFFTRAMRNDLTVFIQWKEKLILLDLAALQEAIFNKKKVLVIEFTIK